MDAEAPPDRPTSLADADNWRALRPVAILVADGCEGEALVALADRLTSEGASGIDATLRDGQRDSGLIIASETDAGTDDFVVALAKRRHYTGETDPPRV